MKPQPKAPRAGIRQHTKHGCQLAINRVTAKDAGDAAQQLEDHLQAVMFATNQAVGFKHNWMVTTPVPIDNGDGTFSVSAELFCVRSQMLPCAAAQMKAAAVAALGRKGIPVADNGGRASQRHGPNDPDSDGPGPGGDGPGAPGGKGGDKGGGPKSA